MLSYGSSIRAHRAQCGLRPDDQFPPEAPSHATAQAVTHLAHVTEKLKEFSESEIRDDWRTLTWDKPSKSKP
jgi:hypothetical protein